MKRNCLVNVFFVLVVMLLINTGTAFSVDPGSLVITDQGDVDINGDVNVDGAKKIKLGTDDGVNPYLTLDKGEIIFKKYYDGAYREFKPVLRFESGVANSGDTVLIPGYWASAPAIQLFPLQMKVYDPSFPDEDQVFQLQAQNIQPQPGQAHMYQFDADAAIIINNAQTIPVSVGTTTSSAATTFYSYECTDANEIPTGTRQVTVTEQSKSHYQNGWFNLDGGGWTCDTESIRYYIDLQCFYNGEYHTEATTYITSHPSNTYTQRVLQSTLTEHDITKFRFRYRFSSMGTRISHTMSNCPTGYVSSIIISSFDAYVPPTNSPASGTVNWIAIGR